MALNICQKREIQKVRMKKKLKEMVCYNLISYPIFEYLGSKNEAALLRDQPFLWVYYTVYYMNTKSKKVAIF